MRRHLRSIICAALVSLMVSAVVAPAAHAAEQTDAATQGDGKVTWMVRPSDGVGEDGRSWVELELDPGETVQEHMLVRNLSDATVAFRLSAADGYFTDTGRFNMRSSDQESVDAGTWITIDDTVEVPAGGQAVVPFTVTVPENATPGDHPAGVAAAIRSGGNAEVGVESRVGFRVMTRVTGELAPAASATVSGAYEGTINPFETGRLGVGYAIENTGNTRLSVVPQVRISTLFGAVSYELPGEEIVEIAPGETRSANVTFPSVWPLFAYSAEVTASVQALTEGAPTGEVDPATAQANVIAIPWSQLVTLAIAAVLIWLLWRDRRRRDRRTAALIRQAREDALAEAGVEPEPALRRRRRTPVAFVAVLLAVFALGVQPAFAADPVTGQQGSMNIQVEIRATPGSTPTPTPTSTPTQSASTSAPDDEALPATGSSDLSALIWLGVAALGVGAVVVLTRRRRTTR